MSRTGCVQFVLLLTLVETRLARIVLEERILTRLDHLTMWSHHDEEENRDVSLPILREGISCQELEG